MTRLSRLTAASVVLAIAPFAVASAQDNPLPPPGPFQAQDASPSAQQRLVGPDWNAAQSLPYWMQITPPRDTARGLNHETGAGTARSRLGGGFGFSGGIEAHGQGQGQGQGQSQGQGRYRNQSAGPNWGREPWGQPNWGRPNWAPQYWGQPYGAPAGSGYFPPPWSQGYAPWQGNGAPAFAPYGYGAPEGYVARPGAGATYGDQK